MYWMATSLWSTYSQWIAFGCSPNARCAAKCCLPYLGDTSILNDHFVFVCRIHIPILFAFRKPDLHMNTNKTQMQTRHAKTKWTFDTDVLPKWGKQHSAVREMFGKQQNATCKLTVLQRKFAYNMVRCMIYLLIRWMPNSVQMYRTFSSTCFCMPHSRLCSDVNPA